ncbi:hypothetical protein WR25_01868 isoform H [Diploscapter pachys]|nr:hypothetical protein WR25_01868 isoform F [Diploscapter pachys]PAV78136.1 hypothetical protein WR25_01868 isoform H [Diploscapter pachys]
MAKKQSIVSCGSYEMEKGAEDINKGRRAERILWIVAVLSAIFIAAEFTGGLIASSLAIATDAGHMLSDLLSFIISIVAIRSSRQPASKRLSFGYDRAEVIGALISVIILWVLTTVLVVLAIHRIVEKDYEVNADVMLITAICGVAFNIVMGAVLHVGSAGRHSHSHGGSSHSHDTRGNVNVRAALIHVIGDLIQSIGVLIAAIVIKFTGYTAADPICTFLFSIIVLFTTIHVLKDIFYVLMEATPSHLDFNSVKKELLQIEGVLSLHDLHLWNLSMDKLAFSVHLAIEDDMRAMEIVAEARNLMREKFGISTATIQVEPFDKSMEEYLKEKIEMFSSLVFPALFFFTMTGRTTGQILSCFYEIENFNVSIIEPSLCTHIILIGSSDVDNIGHFQEPPNNVTEEFVKLKNRAPVKLLLAVTGNSAHFTTLVSSEATMQQFADESFAYLDRSGIDGIDIDWEFPVWSWGAKKSDRTRFGDLLRILRQQYGTKKLITVDVAGPPTIAKYSYQADYLNK